MDSLIFYFDRCCGASFPEWLRRVKTPFVVEYHNDKKHGFSDNTPDDEWLHKVGANKWIVFSHDKKFHKDSMAMAAVEQHKVACFYLDGGTLPIWDKMVLFARSYVKVREIVKSTKPPYIYQIKHDGSVKLVAGGWSGGQKA